MKFPYVISTDQSLRENWENRFCSDPSIDRTIREVVWRRHQSEENKYESGWRSSSEYRRRVIHVNDKYGFNDSGFVLERVYLYLHLTLPKEEMDECFDLVMSSLDSCWNKSFMGWSLGDLSWTMYHTDTTLDITVLNEEVFGACSPWEIFGLGIRPKQQRGSPQIISPAEVLEHAPFQIELGCGPSLEAGIPPLSYFHNLYSIMNPDGSFVFNIGQDCFLKRLITDTENLYSEIAKFHNHCIRAKTGLFYDVLAQLKNKGMLIEPVFTNNFDGLVRSVGVEEFPLFGFEKVYPQIDFKADTLLVIGSHADRRKVREQARKAGMKIIYIDPEVLNGSAYLLEDPQDEDMLVKATALEFAEEAKQWN